jgi:hypothetical protein
VLEILNLPESLFGGGLGFVRAAEVLAFFGKYFITATDFLDHGWPPNDTV